MKNLTIAIIIGTLISIAILCDLHRIHEKTKLPEEIREKLLNGEYKIVIKD